MYLIALKSMIKLCKYNTDILKVILIDKCVSDFKMILPQEYTFA